MNPSSRTRVMPLVLALGAIVGIAGCGNPATPASGTPISVVPLTEEQKAAIKANDQVVEDSERGANYKVGKKR